MEYSVDWHKDCNLCSLRSGCSQVVAPDAPRQDIGFRIYAVGEAPGADEDEQGRGFVGDAGKKLVAVMRDVSGGLVSSRDHIGCANIVCCRPPENRKPKRSELKVCSPWLSVNFSERHDADLILAVGGTAASHFYDGKSLFEILERADQRGFICDLEWTRSLGVPVVPMPHTSPLAWNRNAPSGEKWSDIGYSQIKKAFSLLGLV